MTPVAVRAAHDFTRLPRHLLRELRTDHAGETGAVMIYRGVLAVSRDPGVREFARHHLDTESHHLHLIEQVLPRGLRSRLLPVWRVAGFATGALPALFGARAVYATIESVETFVDRHYAAQVDFIDRFLARPMTGGEEPDLLPSIRPALLFVRALLEECRLDEVMHRDDAHARWERKPGRWLAAWGAAVGFGSNAAVRVCRHL